MSKRCNNCFQFHNDSSSPCPYCGYVEGTPPKETVHLYPGTELLGRYIIGQVVGFGGFGTTYKAWDKLCNSIVAIKEYLPIGSVSRNPSESKVMIFTEKERTFKKGLSRFIDEAASMMRFNKCDNIVNIYNYFEVNNTGYIVMELLEGQTLSSFLKKRKRKLPFEESISIISDVCDALDNLHRVGMVHRDISPENIFMCLDGKVKLIDFGAARETLDEEKKMTIILKPGYAPPEQYESVNKQGPWTDIYAVGATLYLLLTGSKPLESTSRMSSDKLVPPNKVDSNIPLYLSNLVMKALALDINKRYKSMEEFKQVLLSKTKVANKDKSGRDIVYNTSGLEDYDLEGYDLEAVATVAKTKRYKKNKLKPTIILSVILTSVAVICLVIILEKAELFSNARSIKDNTNKSHNKKEITIWYTFDQTTEFDVEQKKKGFKKIEDFYEEHNNVDIKFKYFTYEQYEKAIKKACESGDMPDIYESTNLPDKYLVNAAKSDTLVGKGTKKSVYGLKKLMSTYEYEYKLPLGFKLPIIFINKSADNLEDDMYDYYLDDIEKLTYYYNDKNNLVDRTSASLYENYENIDQFEHINFDGLDYSAGPWMFLKPGEYCNMAGFDTIWEYFYFFGSTINYFDIHNTVNEQDSEILIDMAFYTKDDTNVGFMNCFSLNNESLNLKEAKDFYRFLYSDEAQEDLYADGEGRILPLNKIVLHNKYNFFFNDYCIEDVMKKYKIFR